jgi:hemoglobin
VGVTEALIETVVRAFYAEVRSDSMLGPVFNAAIPDWEPHLVRMCDFWSSVLLMSGRFKGAPMAAHVRLPDLGPGHFAHWVELFRATVRRVCPEPAAELFIAKAEMIAESLQLGIAASRGELPPISEARPARGLNDPTFPNRPETPAMLPEDARPYRRTPVFTEDTVPAGLLRAHTTKEGAWALIHVLEGRLAYRVCDPRRLPSEVVLTPVTEPGLIEPTVAHLVEPLGAVRFYVEFHQRAEVDSPSAQARPSAGLRCTA